MKNMLALILGVGLLWNVGAKAAEYEKIQDSLLSSSESEESTVQDLSDSVEEQDGKLNILQAWKEYRAYKKEHRSEIREMNASARAFKKELRDPNSGTALVMKMIQEECKTDQAACNEHATSFLSSKVFPKSENSTSWLDLFIPRAFVSSEPFGKICVNDASDNSRTGVAWHAFLVGEQSFDCGKYGDHKRDFVRIRTFGPGLYVTFIKALSLVCATGEHKKLNVGVYGAVGALFVGADFGTFFGGNGMCVGLALGAPGSIGAVAAISTLTLMSDGQFHKFKDGN